MNYYVSLEKFNQIQKDTSIKGKYLSFDKSTNTWIALKRSDNSSALKIDRSITNITKFLGGIS